MSAANLFIGTHVPLLWESLIGEYGKIVNYLPEGDGQASRSIILIWMEGAADEEISPGRYSSAFVKNADLDGIRNLDNWCGLPALASRPIKGDVIEKDGALFDVVRVDAYAYAVSRVVLKERGSL